RVTFVYILKGVRAIGGIRRRKVLGTVVDLFNCNRRNVYRVNVWVGKIRLIAKGKPFIEREHTTGKRRGPLPLRSCATREDPGCWLTVCKCWGRREICKVCEIVVKIC